MRKRSLTILGHSTSIRLEPEFWAWAEFFAQHDQQSLSSWIGHIDINRRPDKDKNLASLIRVAILNRLSDTN